MNTVPLIKSDFKQVTKIFPIQKPNISSGGTYYFTTDSGLEYQVTFGKKKNNYLGNIVNFSVISDEYEDEYSETNKGEVFRIISTMIEVIRIYHENHPYSNSYEFSGEFKEDEKNKTTSIRTRLYERTALKVIDFDHWKMTEDGNKVILTRIRHD